MGAFIKILPWIAIYAFIGVVVGCAMYTWSKDDDKETLAEMGGFFWPVAIIYILVSVLCTKVFIPYFKWLKSGRPYFSGEMGKSCVQCKNFTYVELSAGTTTDTSRQGTAHATSSGATGSGDIR